MILRCRGEERDVLVWMLRPTLPADGYLAKVLNDARFNADAFASAYVNEAATLIGAANERTLCAERREGIAAILQDGSVSLDAEVAAFIEATRGVDAYQVLPWLTNRTRLETLECVRRLRTADLRTLPRAFFDAFPLLEDYLAPYALGDAALLDRFHGFIRGRDIPRMNEGLKVNGWALNTEYFSEILHLMRAQSECVLYHQVVDGLVAYPKAADARDTAAVLRLCTAYLKLLMPHVTSVAAMTPEDLDDFRRYCLRPAVAMRTAIRRQLQILDPREYGGKSVAAYTLRTDPAEGAAADGE